MEGNEQVDEAVRGEQVDASPVFGTFSLSERSVDERIGFPW